LIQYRGGIQRSDPHAPAAEVLLVAEPNENGLPGTRFPEREA